MPVGQLFIETLPALAARITTRHVRRGSGFAHFILDYKSGGDIRVRCLVVGGAVKVLAMFLLGIRSTFPERRRPRGRTGA